MELSDEQKQKIEDIAEQYGIADVYLFGSQISGFKHPESDFDIAVRFRNGLPFPQKRGKIYGNLYSDLVGILGEKDLDLVFTQEAPLHVRFRIVTEGEILYTSDLEDSLNYKEMTINYYRDYKFFIDEFFEGVLQR